ncbi:AAA family ATPase [Polyangium sp. 15x6]|uniref:AAA family ATPase n=1 Tax=Polyangium sp. 15x6 TaxID=3042687 RepID=UPI00249B1F76|nr:AAA family ATPase [Polyangium sp. 15x6]MDI3287336.1 AAA family ATPase [Polyangium sp. 15x6]
MFLAPTLADELKRDHARLVESGSLPSEADLRRYYDTFAAKFGPAALRRLDGVELLETLHAHGNKDSLVYWLEFKNDPELPAIFGSIAGGSALKFGLYKRKETGRWMTGSPVQQEELSLEDAISMARSHRDQFVAAAAVLDRFRASGGDDYEALQKEIERAAPDIAETAWGHKYLSLLYPDLLDDYHAPQYQRFHLIKLLQKPPLTEGRYVAAGAFIPMARELGMPVNHLSRLLNERHGSLHWYYRVGTSSGNERRDEWPAMRHGNFVAIGWPRLKDLSAIEHNQAGKERVKALMAKHYSNDPRALGRSANQIFKFVTTMNVGDLVLAADGETVLGIGRIKGDYQYTPGVEFCHRRPVEWLSIDEWKMPERDGLMTTVHLLTKPAVLIEAERRIPKNRIIRVDGDAGDDRPLTAPPRPLDEMPARIEEVLLRKGQVILYGPPGTGKTYWALRTANELAARAWFGRSHTDLTDEQRETLKSAVMTCTFHPAYGYEDFLEGFRPVERAGTLGFERRDGVFKRLCDDARRHRKPVYLVIDEINRGDIPRIFGELLTLLEKSKRGTECTLPLSGQRFSVPENVFVIGTMNTADRSIALLDAALRRRFGFIELMPDGNALGDAVVKGLPLGPWLMELNKRILQHVKRDARNLQVGHTYFMHGSGPLTDVRRLVQVVREDLLPLLEEYCYEDYEALEKILGGSLVKREQRGIEEELFKPGREDDLVDALLLPTPDLKATGVATRSDAESNTTEEDEGDDPPGETP